MKKTKPLRKNIIFKIIILVALVIFAVQLIQYQVQINENQKKLEAINTELREQTVANDELKRYLEAGYDKESYERLIRKELGYGYPDEQVFKEIAGD
ncbi:MAG: septum formation initiator family protein [Clostridia bacterium]|nr:septum formation initiator family protein [Clostridia bacterium]